MAANVWGTSWGGSTGSWLASWALEATTPVVVASTAPGPAGRSSVGKRKRKIVVGARVYEVDSLRDVEFLLKRVVRQEVEETLKPLRKARTKVVDRVTADLEPQEAVPVPMASAEVDWSPLVRQLELQDAAYVNLLMKAISRQEEDDIETVLLMLH